MHKVQQQLVELIHSKTGIVPELDDTFASLKIDSLGLAELTVEIERAFNIRVGEDVLDVETMRELIAYICEKIDCS